MTHIDIVDIHTHYRPTWWVAEGHGQPYDPATQPRFVTLDDPDALIAGIEAGGIDTRLAGAPVDLLFGGAVPVPTDLVHRVNDYLADLVRENRPRLGGLATVDAHSGEEGAVQARHALGELGLDGLVLDSYRDGSYVGSDRTRPTLEVAAEFGVPVFVHPVWAPSAAEYVAAAGQPGNSFGRGLTNGLALLSVLHSTVLDDLPELEIVFTALGTGALLFGADAIAQRRAEGSLRIHVDTLRLHVPTLKYLIDVLGPDNVVLGTDWPIRDGDDRHRIVTALRDAGLDEQQVRAVAGGTTRRLLAGRHAPAVSVR